MKTIDHESQHNYSQISDEIDGVRQNLVKIKVVKKNVGVSVERRRLLRDKGLRILPSKRKGDVDYFTVRTSNGKDVNIPCSDFYDGDTLRKQLNIDRFDLAVTPNLQVENSDNEDAIDFTSADSRGQCHSELASNLKEFRYRKITPPLRPGSRRNFKNVDDENSEDEEKLFTLENITSRERKYGILRPQTAYAERERQASQRVRSRTCPANIQKNEGKVSYRKLSRKSTEVAKNNRKESRGNDSVVRKTDTPEKSEKQEQKSDNQQKGENYNDSNMVLEEKISLKPSIRPKLRPRSLTVGFGAGMSRTVAGLRRKSLDTDEDIEIPEWFQSYTPETSPRAPKKSVAMIVNEENKEREERKVSAKPVRKVSWKDNERNVNNDNKLSEASMPCNASYIERTAVWMESSLSAKSQPRSAGRVKSAPQPRQRHPTYPVRKGPKVNGRRSSHDFVYDARPDKALSKGYMTMQITIGHKQVKVYVPKFSPGECLDDVTVERARAKSAVKVAVGISRPVAGKRK